MRFPGFTDDDFEIFSLPDFDTRMPALKERITPKLKQLGAILTPKLIEETGMELFAHTALHLRRSVHPAEETWTAFSRSNRAYKPFTHLRVAINGCGIKIACFMEEYSDDKPVLAAGLKRNAVALASYLKEHPEIRSHDSEANYGKLLDGRTMTKADLLRYAERLASVKSQHANFSVRLDREDGRVHSPQLVQTVLECLLVLVPIYKLGAETNYKLQE